MKTSFFTQKIAFVLVCIACSFAGGCGSSNSTDPAPAPTTGGQPEAKINANQPGGAPVKETEGVGPITNNNQGEPGRE